MFSERKLQTSETMKSTKVCDYKFNKFVHKIIKFIDIDECLTNNGGCGNLTCKNTMGSFICAEKNESNQAVGIGVGVTFGLAALLLLVLLFLFFLKKHVFYLFFFFISFFFLNKFSHLFSSFSTKEKRRDQKDQNKHFFLFYNQGLFIFIYLLSSFSLIQIK